MRSSDEICADAVDRLPFSNSADYGAWDERWCERCVNEDWSSEELCPILDVAISGWTPREWTPTVGRSGDYVCSEFEERYGCDDGEPDPQPRQVPEVDGQAGVFETFAGQTRTMSNGMGGGHRCLT